MTQHWQQQVELWGLQEIVLASSRAYANPFAEVRLQAEFSNGERTIRVDGFYDGDDVWKIRFMPEDVGRWIFKVRSNDETLNETSGAFLVVAPAKDNHGPVHSAKTYHFDYADGTPYFLLGTTSYNWLNREQALQERTLATLRQSAFNKLRFCLFPKWFVYNRIEPEVFPFVRREDGSFDFDRFEPRFFANVERRINELQQAGIEADVILFHPYDNEKWGFASLDQGRGAAYLRYVVARLAAFRNVWWTMANEYDAMGERDWDVLSKVVYEADPYRHLLSNHYFATWCDFAKPYFDHTAMQDGSTFASRTAKVARRRYAKPIVIDEYQYEGNNHQGWGDLTGFEAALRHWEITMEGAYGSHGETYVHSGGIQWWAAGGELVGESPARLAFLKSVMTDLPFQELVPAPELVVNGTALAKPGHSYLFFFTRAERDAAASRVQLRLAGAQRFEVELIDPWLMKIYPLGITRPGDQAFAVPLSAALFRITTTDRTDEEVEEIGVLLARFAGETGISDPWIQQADSALFKAEPLRYSLEFPIAQMLQNVAAAQVIRRYLPDSLFHGWSLAVSPGRALKHHRIDLPEDKMLAMQAELERIEVQ